MTDRLFFDGLECEINKAELHLPMDAGGRMMYLGVSVEPERLGFGLWEVELVCVEAIDDLDGKRIHAKADGESYDDDTAGADMLGAYSTSDLNYLSYQGNTFCYGDILVDFKKIQGRKYQIHIELALTDSDEDPEDLPPEAYNHQLTADYTVEVDEKNPYED